MAEGGGEERRGGRARGAVRRGEVAEGAGGRRELRRAVEVESGRGGGKPRTCPAISVATTPPPMMSTRLAAAMRCRSPWYWRTRYSSEGECALTPSG